MVLIVDTDGASDDAAALLLAAASPELQAVTVTGGVVDVDQAGHNALVTLAVAGRHDVPVYRGASRPLLGVPFAGAEGVHGPGGLGGYTFPAPPRTIEAEPAADALDRLLAGPDVTLVTLGPLTNLAAALARGTGIGSRGVRVVAMAGSQDAVGNVSAVAEYNVFCDPEAAAAVLRSGMDTTIVGWDVSRRHAVIGDEEHAAIAAVANDASAFLLQANESLDRFCRETQHLAGYDLPDAAAVGVALDDTIVTRDEFLPVMVETGGHLCRGMTVVDHRPSAPGHRVRVVWEIDHSRWMTQLLDALRKLGSAPWVRARS